MQRITVVYGGEDSRSLMYQSEFPVVIGGDDNSTLLHFSFPQGYESLTKVVIFDIRIHDDNGNYIFAEYPLDNNDDLLLPSELTSAGRGRTGNFKLKVYGENYVEQSKQLGITFGR